MPLIKEELYRVAQLWNLHRIRPQHVNEDSPPGRPDVLYFLPQLNNKRDYLKPITLDEIEAAEEVFTAGYNDSSVYHEFDVFEELARLVMEEDNLIAPTNPDEALQLYINILEHLNMIGI